MVVAVLSYPPGCGHHRIHVLFLTRASFSLVQNRELRRNTRILRITRCLGDAGMIIFGPLGREILSGGTIIFAIFGTVMHPSKTLSTVHAR